MDRMWQVFKRSLQAGVFTAADRAETLARLARARLDIAAARTQISRAEAELGRKVFRTRQAAEIPADAEAEIDELCSHLQDLHVGLQERLQALAALEEAYIQEAQPPAEPSEDELGVI